MAPRPSSKSTATVLEVVRTAIMHGELGSGEQIRQQEWAERCGVSRPPLREALEILASEGLLVHGLNKGYFVAKFSAEEMNQLYTMRFLLERELVESLPWPGADEVAALHRLADRIEVAAVEGRPDVALELLLEFYLEVYRLSPRVLIVTEVERLWQRTARYRALHYDVLGTAGQGRRRLQRIIDALANRDRASLAEALLQPTRRGIERSGGGAGT